MGNYTACISLAIWIGVLICGASGAIIGPVEDRAYDPSVKTILLNPGMGQKDAILPAILPLTQPVPLTLSFDILSNNTENLTLRIVHCNMDWTLSDVNASLYMLDMNDIQIQDIQSSFNTRVRYQHYSINLPRVQLSGNYAAMVYKNYNEEEILLTRRFLIYEEAIRISPTMKPSMVNRNTSQQTDFTIVWGGAQLVNPMLRLKPVVRQNYQWYQLKENLEPTMPRESDGIYEYFYFNGENSFAGLNEFRFFDLRSLRVVGMNIDRIEFTNDRNDAFLLLDKPRRGINYSTFQDLDGMFVPEHYESRGYTIEPDYCNVTFFLEAPPAEYPGRIFIYGALSDWKLQTDFEMIYDPELKLYRCTALLKQGFYNYCYTYLPQGSQIHDIAAMEGSHFSTQNHYDFLVYYRPPGKNFDLLIGYEALNYLGR
ncbi:MAG: DUF5103 domain-containing protein [Cytophagaceae bacterium]|jgi:hypothetical protein|nr:DUF5103 domain-containing protein [Cytophagaceae bacterium]